MTRLLRSEIRRLAGRRLVRWLLLISLALVVTLVVIIAARSDRSSISDQDVMSMTQLWLTKAAAARLHVTRDNAIGTISVLSYLLVVVIGASAVGAEYRAGTVGTVLTWEPRRTRLLLARLAAAGLVAMAFFLAVHLVMIGGWALGAELRGRTGGADADFWRELFGLLGRAALLAGALAVISGALATIGKNTAAALGIWFGYLIAVEAILRNQLAEAVPWFLTPNLAAFYEWERAIQTRQVVTPGAAALRLAVYVLILGSLAVVVFHRRDVT